VAQHRPPEVCPQIAVNVLCGPMFTPPEVNGIPLKRGDCTVLVGDRISVGKHVGWVAPISLRLAKMLHPDQLRHPGFSRKRTKRRVELAGFHRLAVPGLRGNPGARVQ
jgi:hypothetical protein